MRRPGSTQPWTNAHVARLMAFAGIHWFLYYIKPLVLTSVAWERFWTWCRHCYIFKLGADKKVFSAKIELFLGKNWAIYRKFSETWCRLVGMSVYVLPPLNHILAKSFWMRFHSVYLIDKVSFHFQPSLLRVWCSYSWTSTMGTRELQIDWPNCSWYGSVYRSNRSYH